MDEHEEMQRMQKCMMQMAQRKTEFAQHEVIQAMKQGVLMPGMVNLRQPATMPPEDLEERAAQLTPRSWFRQSMPDASRPQSPEMDEERMREAYLHRQSTHGLEEQQMFDQRMSEQRMLQQNLQEQTVESQEAAVLEQAAQIQATKTMEDQQVNDFSKDIEREMQREVEQQNAERDQEARAATETNEERTGRQLYEVTYKTYEPQDAMTFQQLLHLNRIREEEGRSLRKKYAEKKRRMDELAAEKARILALEEEQAMEMSELQEEAKKQEKQHERQMAWNQHLRKEEMQEVLEQQEYIKRLEQELRLRQQQMPLPMQQAVGNMAIEKQQPQAEEHMAALQQHQQHAARMGQQQAAAHMAQQHAAHMGQQQAAAQMAGVQPQQNAAGHMAQQHAAHMGQQQAAAQMAGVQPQQNAAGHMAQQHAAHMGQHAAPTTPRMPYVGEYIAPTPHTMFFRPAVGGADGQPFEKRGVQGHTMMTPEPCRLKDCFFAFF